MDALRRRVAFLEEENARLKQGIKAQQGREYIGVGVGGLIINDEGKIFLGKRGPDSTNEVGKWDCPGGKVDYGQTALASLMREMGEEFGIQIEVKELIGNVDHIIPEEQQHWLSPVFLCKIISGEPKILEAQKCTEIGWFTFEEASRLDITSSTRDSLRLYASKLARQ